MKFIILVTVERMTQCEEEFVLLQILNIKWQTWKTGGAAEPAVHPRLRN